MVAEVEAALDAGAFGLSTGLIYAPGMHAAPAEIETLVAAAARRGGLYATHMRNEADGLFASLAESIAAVRARRVAGARLQVSHLKCGSRAVWGRAGEAVARARGGAGRGSRRRRRPVPVHGRRDDAGHDPAAGAARASASTPASAPSTDPHVRDLVRAEIARGISGWENVASDPGWDGLRISYAASHPDWSGRSLAELGGRDPTATRPTSRSMRWSTTGSTSRS